MVPQGCWLYGQILSEILTITLPWWIFYCHSSNHVLPFINSWHIWPSQQCWLPKLTISKIQCYGRKSWFCVDLLTWPIFKIIQAQDLTYVFQNSVDLLPLLFHWQYLKFSVTDVCPDSALTCWLGQFSKLSKLRIWHMSPKTALTCWLCYSTDNI